MKYWATCGTSISLKFTHTKEIDLGHARARAVRMSYVGGPGHELQVPVEMARHVHLALQEAGADMDKSLGLRNAGYYAVDALRIEAGRRAWGHELGPDEAPFEANLMFAVKLDKATPFIGQAVLQRAHGPPLKKKLLSVVFDDPAVYAWGGEAIAIDGATVGELSSVGCSPKAGARVGLGYVRGAAALVVNNGTPVRIDLWGQPVAARAWDDWPHQPA